LVIAFIEKLIGFIANPWIVGPQAMFWICIQFMVFSGNSLPGVDHDVWEFQCDIVLSFMFLVIIINIRTSTEDGAVREPAPVQPRRRQVRRIRATNAPDWDPEKVIDQGAHAARVRLMIWLLIFALIITGHFLWANPCSRSHRKLSDEAPLFDDIPDPENEFMGFVDRSNSLYGFRHKS
jgi:hypothetical protein